MKSPLWLACSALMALNSAPAFAGSHQAQSIPSYVPAHRSAHAATAFPGSAGRSQPYSRNFNRPVFGGQRVTSTSGFNQQRLNEQRFAQQRLNQQHLNEQQRLNQQHFNQQRFGSRGQFSERARVAASAHDSWWWRHHHHDRIVFIDTFGFDPLFFDPWFYGSYPYGYYPYPYGYYPDNYPGGYEYDGPGYDSSDDSSRYDSAAPGYSSGRSYRGGGGGGGAVLEVQRRLSRDGYYHGSVDGVMGSRTRYAIRAYQRDHGLRADGEISEELLRTIGVR